MKAVKLAFDHSFYALNRGRVKIATDFLSYDVEKLAFDQTDVVIFVVKTLTSILGRM